MNSPQALSFLTRPSLLATFLAISVTAIRVSAAPYASGLTNNAGTVSFVLNEAADSVQVISNGGATTNTLGALPAGTITTNLAISGVFTVVVAKANGSGYIFGETNIINSDTNPLLRFPNGRGVTVSTDPKSGFFGRVFVANSTPASSTGIVRAVGRGIYALKADLSDALGFGNTAQTGGIAFSPTSASSPGRLSIGQDNRLYVADLSDDVGGLYSMDGDLTGGLTVLTNPGGPFPVGTTRNHGSVQGAAVIGYASNSTLTAFWVDQDLQTNKTSTSATELNSLWRLDIGSTLPATNDPVKIRTPQINFTSQTMDTTRGPDGKLYMTQYRSAGNESILWIFAPDGTFLTNSLLLTRAFTGNSASPDLLAAGQCVDVSPLGDYLAMVKDSSLTLIVPLTNGIPDLNKLQTVDTRGGNANSAAGDVAFDAAGNLYVLSANQTLRVFPPGGTTTATTTSDGTFSVTNIIPNTTVSVTATTPLAAETTPQGNQNGVFTVTRTGDNSLALPVKYTFSGTAVNGTDYVLITNTVVIGAGQNSATVTVIPIDDSVAQPIRTVILTLAPFANYQRQAPLSATVTIVDNDTPALSVTAVDALTYERVTRDVLQYRFTRIGLTNNAVTFNLAFSGTAVNGVDYGITNGLTAVPTTFTIPAGAITADLPISPINDNLVEGSETVIVTVAPPGTGYTVGTPAAATGTIIDDDLPTETVLFSDNFDTDTSANWTMKYGANFGGQDAFFAFNFDYYNNSIDPFFPDLIPPSPRTADAAVTRGLKMSVNKDFDGNVLDAAAGINFYPKNQSFSNNFILRFSLFMDVGGGSTTEHAVFGINHSGNFTNRFSVSTDTNGTTKGGDGIWFSINNDNGTAANTFSAWYTPNQANPPVQITNRTALGTLFPNPPYDVAAGLPGILAAGEATNFTWVDVEVSQLGRVITLKLNNTVIFTFNNPSIYTNGNIMLGYADAFNSTGDPLRTFVVYDDVRVIATLPTVNVISNSFGAEPGTGVTNGSFTVFRNGGTNTALTVNYAITGSAINGTDYQTLPTSVVIPIGAYSTTITYVPLSDNLVETNETVILTLTANANYDITGANPLAATNIIRDTLPVMPTINTFALTSTNTTFALTGGISDRTNQFVLESSSVVTGLWAADLNAIVQFQSNGSFTIISTNLTTSNRFYRIKR